jgi:hypothetical protein
MSEQTTADERDTEAESESCELSETEKKVYQKPELRKYSQIDYVTAYGVD